MHFSSFLYRHWWLTGFLSLKGCCAESTNAQSSTNLHSITTYRQITTPMMNKAGEEQDVRRLRVQAGLPLLPPVSISARTCTLPPYTSLGQAHSTSARHEGARRRPWTTVPQEKSTRFNSILLALPLPKASFVYSLTLKGNKWKKKKKLIF